MTRESCQRDVWIGVCTFVCGLLYLLFISSQVSPESDGPAGVSGRTLPYIVGATLLGLGALLAGASWQRMRTASRAGSVLPTRAALLRVSIYAGAIALYALGISTLGYVVSTAPALLFAMLFSGARKRITLLLVTLIVPPLMYLGFHVLMKIPLPEAMFF